MRNLTKCLSTYLEIVILASLIIFQMGCATPIEWTTPEMSDYEREQQTRATHDRVKKQLAEDRKRFPGMHKRLDDAVSDETVIITDVYDGKIYLGR